MTLGDLLQRGMLHQHTTTAQEIAALWTIAEVGLADARVMPPGREADHA